MDDSNTSPTVAPATVEIGHGLPNDFVNTSDARLSLDDLLDDLIKAEDEGEYRTAKTIRGEILTRFASPPSVLPIPTVDALINQFEEVAADHVYYDSDEEYQADLAAARLAIRSAFARLTEERDRLQQDAKTTGRLISDMFYGLDALGVTLPMDLEVQLRRIVGSTNG